MDWDLARGHMGAIYSLLFHWEPFVFFALGCLDGEVQTTNILWSDKSADSLVSLLVS